MTITRHTITVTVAATAILLTSGCVSKQTGKQGNLVFGYVADDDSGDFNKPIAVGAKLDVYVRQKGNNKPVTITEATTDKPAVLEVTQFQPHFLTLHGKGAGSTEIAVKAQREDGEVVTDAIDMRAIVPEVLTMNHYCTTSNDAYYLTDSTIFVPYELKMKDGENVIGYGYHPIDFQPVGQLVLHADGKHQQHFKLTTPKDAATITISSTIDATELVVSVRDEKDIDDARHEGAKTVLVNVKTPVLIRPLIGTKPVCQAKTSVAVVSKTPDVCAVKQLNTGRKGDDATETWGWVEIDGKAFGTCTFEVTHLKANNQQGLTTSFDIKVAKIVTG